MTSLETYIEAFRRLGSFANIRTYPKLPKTPFSDDRQRMRQDSARVAKAIALAARNQYNLSLCQRNNQQGSDYLKEK